MIKSPSTQLLFDRLAALLAVDVAAALAVVVESGHVDFPLAGAAVAVAIALAVYACARLLNGARPTDVAHVPSAPLDNTKKILLLAMLAGFVALVGGRGTWSSFSAETSNSGSTITSGILTLSNTVNSGSACLSTTAGSLDNYNATCDALFAPTNLAPGSKSPLGNSGTFPLPSVVGASWFMSKVVVKNTGTIDASSLSLFAPYGNARLVTTGINKNDVVSSLTVSSFEGSIASGDSITLTYAGNSQTFCTSTAARPTQSTPITSIAIVASTASPSCTNSTTALYDFPVGTRVFDASSDSGPTNTNCFDTKTAASAAFNFNLLSTNPLCQTIELWVQEQTGGYNYCWFGAGSTYQTSYQTTGNAQCVTPTSQAYAGTTIASGTAMPVTLNLGTLNGNIQTGDSLVIKENGASNTCAVTGGPYYIGSTSSVGITSCTGGSPTATNAATTYDASAVVYDSSAFGKLDTTSNNANSTLSNFDTARHSGSGAIFMPPLGGTAPVGTPNATGASPLTRSGGSLDTRTYYVGVYFPNPSGSNQNALQGLTSTFGIIWHMDQ